MTPAARTQAAIDLLDLVIAAAREGGAAADVVVQRYFGTRRYAGSKDRRAVRNLVYEAIRLCGEPPASGRAAMLALAKARPELAEGFDGSGYGAAVIDPDEGVAEASLAPAWLERELAASGLDYEELVALLERAPLDIRVNRLKATREEVAALFPEAEPLAIPPEALRLPPDTVLQPDPRWEVQDAGSQLVSAAVQAKAGTTVIDLCAGAGGKTLALAAAMGDEGRVIASDTDRARLSQLAPRAVRAGVTIAEPVLLDPNREAEALADLTADAVLIDAPCSGTGTWRRNPEARWRLTPDRLSRLAATQARLLDLGATLVRPGGALVYVVCSLLDAEGREQIDAFLGRHPGWRVERLSLGTGRAHGPGVRLTPLHDATDGFFVARLLAA
jgi:16S rRNA (cytosine967-C5)-methyltransferase